MPGSRLTKATKADMLGIGRYTRPRWEREQMRRYVGGIDARFHDLASQPELGRVYLELPPYRRLMCGKHGTPTRICPGAAVSARRSPPPAIRGTLLVMASAASTGVLHGNTITLDAPVPPLEGQRVRVVIAPADDDATLSSAEQAKAWSDWAAHGSQGPIDDEDEPEFP